MGTDDAPSALLTAKQRQALRDEIDVSHPNQLRSRLRKRVQTSIVADGPLLETEVDASKIFADSDPSDVSIGVRSLVAFLYRAADATPGVNAETLIRDGVAEGRGGRLNRIKHKLRDSPSEVTIGDIRLLAEHGELSDEEHTELFEKFIAGELSAENIEQIAGPPETAPDEFQHTLPNLAADEET
jgi:hypothetical protein